MESCATESSGSIAQARSVVHACKIAKVRHPRQALEPPSRKCTLRTLGSEVIHHPHTLSGGPWVLLYFHY